MPLTATEINEKYTLDENLLRRNMANSNILIYQTENGDTKIETRLEDETVWLTIDQMTQLFQKSRSTINEHILNIFEEQELEDKLVTRKIGISDFSTKPTNHYNLDVIISVGYRVKSHQGTKFRQWATGSECYFKACFFV